MEWGVLQSVIHHYKLFGLRGVAARGAAILGGGEFTVSVSSNATVKLRLGTTDVAAYEHVFIEKEYDIPLGFEPATIIDIGANVGMASVYFALRYPKARIIAVEPEPSNFVMLRKNAADFPQITAIHAAIWNRNDRLSVLNGGSHWGVRVSQERGTIPAMTLEALRTSFGMKRIDLLKVDAEGSEQEIFELAPNWIADVRSIFIELHDRFRPGCEANFETIASSFSKRWRHRELTCVSR